MIRTPSNPLTSWDAAWVDVMGLYAFGCDRIRTNCVQFFTSLLVISFTKSRSTPHRVLIPLGSGPRHQPELTTPEVHFNQFARVDEGLWAWYFVLRDAQGEGVASVNRAFRGLGREVRWRPEYSLDWCD